MGKTLEAKTASVPKKRGARIREIVRRMPKMPAAQRRRLNLLMEMSKKTSLSKQEDRELRGLLEQVDRQTYWNLAEAIEIEARESANRKMRETG